MNFSRIAVLYLLDHDKNGKFSLHDIKEFAKFCSKIPASTTYAQELEAQCTLCMWKQATSAEGRKSFVDWFVRCFSTGMKVKVKGYDCPLVNADIVSTIHELLQFKEYFELTPQNLISMMQSVGVEMGLIKPEDELIDNVVPLQTIQIFAENYILGFFDIMSEIGFIQEIYFPNNNPQDSTVLEKSHTTETPSEHSPRDSEDEKTEEDISKKLQPKLVIHGPASGSEGTDTSEDEEVVLPQQPMLKVPSFAKKQFQDLIEDQGIKTPEIRSPKIVQKMTLGFPKLSMQKLGRQLEEVKQAEEK